jgi:hypothetical protein
MSLVGAGMTGFGWQDSFCKECTQNGNKCKNVASPSRCFATFLNGTEDECTAREGELINGTCSYTVEEDKCYNGSALCEGSSADLCTIFDICYFSDSVDETDCTSRKTAANDAYPLWIKQGITNIDDSEGKDIVYGILQYYNGTGFCLYGASSAWYSSAIFGYGSTSKASCNATSFQDARTYIRSIRNNKTACEAPIMVSRLPSI